MENLNVVNDTHQAVVEPENDASVSIGGAEVGTPTVSADAESAVRSQSAHENSGFRKLRLENERYRRELEELKKQLEDMPDAQLLRAENERYLEKLVNDKMSADLEKIRSIDPAVESLESLGGEFIRLIESGIDAKIAFAAIKQVTDGKDKPSPPRTGAVGVSESAGGRFYTSKELDRLTPHDLENPAIYKKAMESLKRL